MDIVMVVTKVVDFMDTVDLVVVMDVNVSCLQVLCKIHSTLSFDISCVCLLFWFHVERFRGGTMRMYFKRHARRRMDYRHHYNNKSDKDDEAQCINLITNQTRTTKHSENKIT